MKPCTLPKIHSENQINCEYCGTYFFNTHSDRPMQPKQKYNYVNGRFIDEVLISRIIKHLEEAADGNEMLGLLTENSFIIEAREILEALTK